VSVAALEFRLLGPLEVRREGRTLALGGARARALLALLLLHRGAVVSVDRIVDELWGESPPATARHMVEVYVSKLRKILGKGMVSTRPPGYVVEVVAERVDLERFERLIGEGREALAAGSADLAAARLGEALAFWRGPALADFTYEPFAQVEIARLEELRLLAEEERIEAELALGKSTGLVAELEELVARAPLRERRRTQLMLALYRSGRQADALAAYRDARETLIEELGVEPGPELRELERAILAQEDWLAGERPARRERPAAPETRKVITVVFAELASAAAEADLEALQPLIERLLERAEEVLERHGAVMERLPDGTLMGVFGRTEAHEDDAVRGLGAAVALRELRVASHAAVETGEVLAGGGAKVSGAPLRAGARLLAAAAPGEVLVGEATRRLAAHAAHFAPFPSDGAPVWRLLDLIPAAPVRAIRVDVPLVGREAELAGLRAAFARTVRDRCPTLVTLVGEPGVGKSRLAREFCEGLEGEALVLVGHCLAYGDGITYWPLREAIVELVGEESAEALAALVAGADDSDGIARRLAAAAGFLDEAYPVEETRWATRRLFETLARTRPLVLVFDDVHWAEPTFLDLLRHVVEVGQEAPLLLVCIARPELFEEHPDWTRSHGRATTLTLEALNPAQAEELVSGLDSTGTLPPERRTRVIEAAQGNPLFLEQLVAFAREKGDDPGLDVPPTLQALLAARLDRLGPGERAVAECAAVVGRSFSGSAVAELMPAQARGTLPRHLEALTRKELLEPERSTLPFEDVFRFRHVLIQEAAYRSLPKQRRAALHEDLAGWLEQGPARLAGDADEIAGYHLEQAYRFRTELGGADGGARALALRAGERLSAAGKSALDRNDLPAAVNLLTRATSLYETAGRPRLDLLVDLGAALWPLGEGRRALAVLDEALQAARSAGEPALEWRARLERNYVIGQLEPHALPIGDNLRTAERAVQVLEPLGDDRALARAWLSVAQDRFWLGKIESSLDASARAVEYAQRAGDRQEEISALRIRSMALWSGPTPTAEAARGCEELLAAAPNKELAAHALRDLGGIRAMQGEAEEARHLVERSLAIYEELGLSLRLAATLVTYGAQVYHLAGDLAAAERELRRALGLLESIGEKGVRSVAAALLAYTLYEGGRYSQAERYVEMGERLAGEDDYVSNTKLRSVRAKILARRGEIEAGKAAVDEAVRMVDATDDLDSRGDAWLDRAEVFWLIGQPKEAASSLERAIELLKRKGNVVLAGRARARLNQLTEPSAVR
jgi:DNA-binding SARP family transcriptional activator/tetratricopeptide (TPR) repeat protein